jgi:hypothetical protein
LHLEAMHREGYHHEKNSKEYVCLMWCISEAFT